MKKGRIIRYGIICVLFVVMIVSGYKAFSEYMSLKKADDVYEKLQNDFVEIITVEETVGETANDAESTQASTDFGEAEDTEVSTESNEPSEPKSEPVKIRVNFDALLKENNDIVGWLYCEGTPLSYPVLHAEDNDKYLRADIYGNYLVSGTIFVDFRNGVPGEDRNYIIYGHHMNNRTMFGSLHDYKDQSYYDAHPTISYLTPNGNYTIQIVAGGVIDKNDIIYNPNPREAELEAYLDNMLNSSTFDSGLTFEKEDKLVTLSTCSYDYDGARFVLIGKLIPNK